MMQWLSNMENTKPLALVIFFVVFVGILWLFRGEPVTQQRQVPLGYQQLRTEHTVSRYGHQRA